MKECEIFQSKIKKKKKHQLTMKHKCFSNLSIKKYIVRIYEIENFKEIIQQHYNNHKKKLDNFSVTVMCKKNGFVIDKFSVLSTFSVESAIPNNPSMIELPIVLRVPAYYILDQFDKGCVLDEVNQIDIVIVSDLNDNSFTHYMIQPKSMLCRKPIKNFIEEDYGTFDYNWLPNCFRHITV